MLDETMNFPKKESNEYPPIPKGIYQAELLEVKANENETYDSKMNQNTAKEYQTDISYQFVLLNGSDDKGALRGRSVWENFGHNFLYFGSKNGKNNLWRIGEAYLGRDLTQKEEATGISGALLNSFVGKQIALSIETKISKKGKSFDKIVDYFKVGTELESLSAEEKDKATVKNEKTPAEQMQSGIDASQAPLPEEADDIKKILQTPF